LKKAVQRVGWLFLYDLILLIQYDGFPIINYGGFPEISIFGRVDFGGKLWYYRDARFSKSGVSRYFLLGLLKQFA
jgi:hypothetical protein